MKTLTTIELLDYVKQSSPILYGAPIEATINHGNLTATHWIAFWDGRFYHEGIDSVRYRTSRRQFLLDYPLTTWTVE